MEQIEIDVSTKKALIHLGSLDSFDITEGGKKAGRCILSYLCGDGGTEKLKRAIQIYEELIPNENFGGEYTALEWMCRLWIAPKEVQEKLLSVREVRGFYKLLSENDFYNLKWYINRKYHFVEIDRKDLEAKDKLRFLEDFILFGNPDRERWEKIKENLEMLDIKEGMTIADVGSGPGFYSFKFGDLVGEGGKVYAIETNRRHLDYLHSYIRDNSITNVEAVESSFEGIGLSPDIRVDMVYICSLYHNVYAAFTDEERECFVGSIRRALKPGGKLVVVDNDLVESDELPYHGPYISKELLLSQLYYYGFEIKKQRQFTPQRYALIFEKKEEMPLSNNSIHAEFTDETKKRIRVTGPSSLVRYRIIGTSTSGFTWNGKRLAAIMSEGIKSGSKELISQAAKGYREQMGKERIGDEYTALLWFCQLALCSEEEKERALSDTLIREYYNFFAGNSYERLGKYLYSKYNLRQPLTEEETRETMETEEPEISFGILNEWSEYLTFNNPNRNLWEKTDKMLEYIDIKEGEVVADIGCGGGYFSWYFSKKVGSRGKVYATEINPDALSYVEKLNNLEKTQIIPKTGALNDVCLDENSIDTMFMCSMYHAVYIASIEFVREEFINSVRRALKPGGRLYVVDNDITARGKPAYFGPGIAKEMVVSQLCSCGFKLADIKQFVPQRYILYFINDK